MPLPLRDFLSRAPRLGCAWQASLDLGESEVQPVTVVSLSLTGAFLETEVRPEPGGRAVLFLPLDESDSPEQLAIVGKVTRGGRARKPLEHPDLDDLVVAVSGVGMEFDELSDQAASQLQDLIDSLLER